MNKKNLYFFSLIMFLLCVVLISCGAGTTQTTNPTAEGFDANSEAADGVFDGNPVDTQTTGDSGSSGDDDGYSESSYTETEVIVTETCDAVADCYGVFNETACLSSLNTDLNYMTGLGVDTGSYESLDAVQDDIDDSVLSVSSSEIVSCVSALQAVSCESMEEAGVYSITDLNDFSRVYLMLPGEC